MVTEGHINDILILPYIRLKFVKLGGRLKVLEGYYYL